MDYACGFYGRRNSVWTYSREWVEMLPQERRKGEMPLRISRHESKTCVQKEKSCSCWLAVSTEKMNASITLKWDGDCKGQKCCSGELKLQYLQLEMWIVQKLGDHCLSLQYRKSAFSCKYSEKGKYRNVRGNMTGSRPITQAICSQV